MSQERKKFLIKVNLFLILVGLFIISIPFFQSLKPSARAGKNLQTFPLSDFPPNTYKFIQVKNSQKIETNSSTKFETGYGWLVIHTDDNSIHTYWLPTWEDKVVMPYAVWGQLEGFCSRFEITLINNKITNESIIQCPESGGEDWLSQWWYWNIDGKNISGSLPDMYKAQHTLVNNELAIYKS